MRTYFPWAFPLHSFMNGLQNCHMALPSSVFPSSTIAVKASQLTRWQPPVLRMRRHKFILPNKRTQTIKKLMWESFVTKIRERKQIQTNFVSQHALKVWSRDRKSIWTQLGIRRVTADRIRSSERSRSWKSPGNADLKSCAVEWNNIADLQQILTYYN